MGSDDEFQIRPGRIRSKSAQRVRSFIHQALAAAQKAGGTVRRGRITTGRSTFGRGRQASLAANRLLTNRSRLTTVKARIVKHRGRTNPLKAHLRYLQREGVTQDGEKAVLFNAERAGVDERTFSDRCADDRHHFRFIVSPEDAPQMQDLTRFTRDLMKQAEIDLGTGLDWVAVSHWNTEHPHIHIIVRGVTDTGDDLVISRDYIKEGLRARAQGLVTDELGPRLDSDIRQSLHRQVDAERFTQLDRQMLLDSRRTGFLDLAPTGSASPDPFQAVKAGRMRKLEALGLADQFAPGQWVISDRTEAVLRDLGERGDIIKRIHRGLAEAHLERPAQALVLSADEGGGVIVGRLLARGLDDELKGTAYVVIDGVDGRTHHLGVPSLEAAGDSAPGSTVSARVHGDGDQKRIFVRVESDLDIPSQITADGATWLDRQLIKPGGLERATTGFGAEVSDALDRRAEHLTAAGLARQDGDKRVYKSGLLQTLTDRDVARAAEALSNGGSRQARVPGDGEHVAGTYRQRLNLASGRFAVLDDGLGFQLVPWSPKIESHLGEPISGQMRSRGSVAWDLGRSRSAGIAM